MSTVFRIFLVYFLLLKRIFLTKRLTRDAIYGDLSPSAADGKKRRRVEPFDGSEVRDRLGNDLTFCRCKSAD